MSICPACFSVANPSAPPKIAPVNSVTILRLLTFLSPEISMNFLRMFLALVKDLKMCFAGFINFGNFVCTAPCNSIACGMDLSMMLVSADRTMLNSDFSVRKFKLSEIFELTVAAIRVIREIVSSILLSVTKHRFQSVFTVFMVVCIRNDFNIVRGDLC